MAQKETHREREKSPFFSLIPEDFAARMKTQTDELAKAQTELFDQCRDANRHWLDRIQTEANVASEFATKLTAARSIPEAMTAYQEWGSRRLAMMAEDTQQLLSDTQKFMQAGARLIADGWQSNGLGVGT